MRILKSQPSSTEKEQSVSSQEETSQKSKELSEETEKLKAELEKMTEQNKAREFLDLMKEDSIFRQLLLQKIERVAVKLSNLTKVIASANNIELDNSED